MDRISSLPDELLRRILVSLHSTRAAARTSLLSRRWRHLWTDLPEIVLGSDDAAPQPALFIDLVDAALAASSTTRPLPRLEIVMPSSSYISSGIASSWLRFAAQHVAGTIDIRLPAQDQPYLDNISPVELPACDRATSITIVYGRWWRWHPCLYPLPGKSFAALTRLTLHHTRMEAWDLETLVSSRCPRLQILELRSISFAFARRPLSLRSGSLVSLFFYVRGTLRLDIDAPRLEELEVSCDVETHIISAPKLTEVKRRREDSLALNCITSASLIKLTN
ncbi:hypothetical protein PR202_ga29625 [Eleusine coracana subsp. coracana]|uniref:F-box domain-containing protein n=1 Tax=Eleusine coracana subsp. coracana TaxID=191504 RepID=A0AAV5DLX5_ELECO|nr:hypothetical protein QOZ80_7AG0571560 [Eleusine coracana subsp. coracana]GJN11431.1 hypothetical protein PR202_ga29625 [Eleusine coracana subsp. coracana]